MNFGLCAKMSGLCSDSHNHYVQYACYCKFGLTYYRTFLYSCGHKNLVSIGNRMNLSAIKEYLYE